MTALLAFHGLSSGQLRALQLTDIRDVRLHLNSRTILLAEAVRVRLTANLDYRNQRWPHTANPHLFNHHRTTLSTKPVGTRWPGLVMGTAARDIRTDRIHEVRATGGDLRRICALFGLSVKDAARYTAVLEGTPPRHRVHPTPHSTLAQLTPTFLPQRPRTLGTRPPTRQSAHNPAHTTNSNQNPPPQRNSPYPKVT
jgi:hypothetical protein